MTNEEYCKALPKFSQYTKWYMTCRKYNMMETDLYIATSLLVAPEKYDPASALILMATYNDNVAKEIIEAEKGNIFPYILHGAIFGVTGGLAGMFPLLLFLSNIL